MGLKIDRGRVFDNGDSPTSQKVAVINRTMARQLFATEDALGRQFRLGMSPTAAIYEVVGVSTDARYTSVRRPIAATVYLSHRQQPPGAMTFEVKTAGDPTAFAAVAREVVRGVDATLPLDRVQSQQNQIAVSLQRERLFATLATSLGLLTLALSAIGLDALLAYGVARRTPEIGIRMALGAERGTVRWMIMRQSLVLALCGLAVGTAGTVAGTKLVEALLFEVQARDPLAIGLAALIMTAVSLLAGYLPARRASRVDPLVALRAE
jgi:ABC-type antimicrobial peptide transport system permease subunit